MNVSIEEFIDCQVEDGYSLKYEETVNLTPLLQNSVIVLDSNNHVDCHEGALEEDPSLLHPILPRMFIGIVIKFIFGDRVLICEYLFAENFSSLMLSCSKIGH